MRSLAVAAVVLLFTSTAGADTFVECPPGSAKVEEGGYAWCRPSVCDSDLQCTPNLCRPVGLCLQIGSLNKPGEPDAGARLIATQICAEDKQCPTQQTCNQHKRCVTPAQADKIAANTATPTPSEPAKKSSCGCTVVGAGEGNTATALGIGALAFSALLVRARRRGARRKPR